MERYAELAHRLCALVIKNEGLPSPEEDKLRDRLEALWHELPRAEQETVDDDPWCGHPDGWLADDFMVNAKVDADER